MIEIKQVITTASGDKLEISRRGISWQPGDRSITGCSALEWAQILARCWNAAGEYWHREILPKHFTHAGATEYDYQGRTPKHLRRKLRKYGHTYPLVFSGDLKRDVLRTLDVRSDQKGARVVLHGPRYLYAYRKDYKQADKAYELSTISRGDAEAIARVLDQNIEAAKAGGISGGGHRGEPTRGLFGGHRAAG